MRSGSPIPLALGVLAVFGGMGACSASPVSWNDPIAIAAPLGAVRLELDGGGNARFVAAPQVAHTSPPNVGSCAASLRTALGTKHLFAVWWAVRADSSAGLLSASSVDSGATWTPPLAVDTADVSHAGCTRPPPSLTVVGDDVHVAYSMVAPEGTGVFFTHFMYGMFHSPVAVIYGERLVPTSIAAQGDTVAVAYEEPNGSRQRIDLALSTTMGHIFAWRTEATRDVDDGRLPAVAIHGSLIAVAWEPAGAADSANARVVRVGRVH